MRHLANLDPEIREIVKDLNASELRELSQELQRRAHVFAPTDLIIPDLFPPRPWQQN